MIPTTYSFSEYDSPPITEVALSVQFDPLTALRTPYIGLLWKEFQVTGLSKIEERPPLEQAFELFGNERLIPHIEITNMPPVRRCWFINEDETELVQVQQDRFVHNWRRKTVSVPYPRYETIRENFLKDLAVFKDFIKKYNIGELKPNQCEVTYVNPIPLDDLLTSYASLDRLLTVFQLKYSDDFLHNPEDANINLRYIITKDGITPLGRLHVSCQPGRPDEVKKTFFLNLTARGRPSGLDDRGIIEFMDLGHEWIVRGFTSITTKQMHSKWGKNNGS